MNKRLSRCSSRCVSELSSPIIRTDVQYDQSDIRILGDDASEEIIFQLGDELVRRALKENDGVRATS